MYICIWEEHDNDDSEKERTTRVGLGFVFVVHVCVLHCVPRLLRIKTPRS